MSYTGSKAQAGRGSTISIASTAIGEITDVPLNLPKWETADVTNFSSGSDAEFITTIRRSANFTIKGNRVSSDTGQVAVVAAYQSGTISAFTLVLPKSSTQTTTGDTYTFNALVLSCSFDVGVTKAIEFSIDLQISGAVTFTAGS
jgi:predicted secreted protein